MGNKQNFFQLALLVIFGGMAVVGFIYVAMFKARGTDTETVKGNVIIWGPTEFETSYTKVLSFLTTEESSYQNVKYIGKNEATMYEDLTEAISSGATNIAPDLIIMNSSELMRLKNKLYNISYEYVPLSNFYETWLQGSEIFAMSTGILGFPLLVDPLVLYWNRDLYTNEAIAQVPKDWDTFITVVPKLSKIIGGADLEQSGIAFGEFDNVLHATEIVSALLMQTGSNIVVEDSNGRFATDLSPLPGRDPSVALNFYTAFSNPIKKLYSWNRTYERSRESFAANKVAMYVGFLSEEETLKEINPNLNFGMSILPQSNNTNKKLTYGDFYAVGIIKSTDNFDSAYKVAQRIKEADIALMLSDGSGLPSARADIVSRPNNTDPFNKVKIESALMAKTWYMPSVQYVNDSFERVIEGINSGRVDSKTGSTMLMSDLEELIKPFNDR